MSSDKNYSKKILRILAEKPAVSLSQLKDSTLGTQIAPKALSRDNYAITRSLKRLKETGFIEQISSPQNTYARLTKEGKKKMYSLKLENENTLVNNCWDGFWRIIILDLSEDRKKERESLRYLLKKANFICIKNTVWVSPYPYEHLFTNIKKDLGLSTELMIIITDKLDGETNKAFLETLKN